MKTRRLLTIGCGLLLAGFLLTGCRSQKVVTEGTTVTDATFIQKDFIKKVSANAVNSQYITSKLKFSASLGGQNVSVGGSLKMKRNDVIRIQLVALGIMEAARLEFTKDYVLFVDRINKQYVKASYDDLDFMRENGINFYTLQALFWNELFQPGKQKPSLDAFEAMPASNDVVISLNAKKMSYQWHADRQNGRISATNISHQGQTSTDAQMNWDYGSFKSLLKQQFPTSMKVKVKAKGRSLNVGLQLSSLDDDSDWDLRTTVSKKYKKVSAEDIFRKLMSL